MTAASNIENSGQVSKRFVMWSFVGSTVFTALISAGLTMYGAAYQSCRLERAAQVEKFVEASDRFEPLIREFVLETKSGKLRSQTKAALQSNLGSQGEALDDAKSVSSDKANRLIAKYESTLTLAYKGLRPATNALDSREFIQQTVHLVEQRDALVAELRRPPSLLLR